jgi:3-oxoacyl-[acyl-carrier protein] reductase
MKKTVFISGAAGFLGVKLIKFFLKKNFNIICTIHSKSKNKNKEFQNLYKLNIDNIKIHNVDFEDENSLKKLITKLIKQKACIDIMINNAASAFGATVELTSIKKLKEIYQINFFSQIHLIQNFLRFLKKSKYPSIINIGSISGLIGEKGYIAYGGSKLSLMYSTKILANELSVYNIRVNAVAPSIFKSNMSDKMDIKSKKKFIDNNFSNEFIDPESIVHLIGFLSSKKAKSINGQIIRIDGGMVF